MIREGEGLVLFLAFVFPGEKWVPAVYLVGKVGKGEAQYLRQIMMPNWERFRHGGGQPLVVLANFRGNTGLVSGNGV